MDSKLIQQVESDQYKARPDIQIGDKIKLHMRISEGGKERIQVFEGLVIAMKGSGMGKTVTVRKISFGVGVERIVPLNSPTLSKVEVVKRGKVRRSKLYYMRDRVGKSAMKITDSKDMFDDGSSAEAPVVEEVVAEAPVEEVVKTEEAA